MPPAIARSRQLVDVVLAQSLAEVGTDGRAALAWEWALTGTRPSPVTLSLPVGRPPSRDEIVAEATAEPEGSTAQPGIPSDYCDQLGEARRILAWLVGVRRDSRRRRQPRPVHRRPRRLRTHRRRHPPGPRPRPSRPRSLRPARPHGPRRRQHSLAMGCRVDERRLAARRPRPARLGPGRTRRFPAARTARW